MASVAKSSSSALATLAVMLLVASAAAAQNCGSELANLATCVPFVAGSGSAAPSAECCSALGSVDNSCLCTTLNIINRLPASCNLRAISCGAQ